MRKRVAPDDVVSCYGEIWDDISMEQGLLVRGNQIIIPSRGVINRATVGLKPTLV